MPLVDLDLRDQRCPLALLLAKRHVADMVEGELCTILVKDHSSKSDIVRFLNQYAFQVDCVELCHSYILNVKKGTE